MDRSSSPLSSVDSRESSVGPFKLPTTPASQTRSRNAEPSLSAASRVVPSSDGEDSSDSDGSGESGLGFLRSVEKPVTSLTNKAPSSTYISSRNGRSFQKKRTKSQLRYSLSSLASRREKQVSADEGIEKAKNMLKFKEAGRVLAHSDLKANEKSFIRAMGEEGAKKAMKAVQKDEGFKHLDAWHFLDSTRTMSERCMPFPQQAVANNELFLELIDQKIRQHRFLSNFIQELVISGEVLPEEVIIWTLEQLATEKREDLCYAYRNVLVVLPVTKLKKLLSADVILTLFQRLGARQEACDLKEIVKPGKVKESFEGELRNIWNVKTTVGFLGQVAACLNKESLTNLAILVIRLSLDSKLVRKTDILAAIEDSLELILGALDDEQMFTVGKSFYDTVKDPRYRLLALRLLPIYNTRIHLFRRRLALTFLFDDIIYMSKAYAELVKLDHFSRLLSCLGFQAHKNTDYAQLQSKMMLMDIAIDSGSTSGEPDGAIDELAKLLNDLHSQIADANAQNLSRTEAKDTIDRLYARLTGAVRSRVLKRSLGEALGGQRTDGLRQTKLNFGKKRIEE